jgi:hypothetical protein
MRRVDLEDGKVRMLRIRKHGDAESRHLPRNGAERDRGRKTDGEAGEDCSAGY